MNQGFTLIELLVVVLIIGILSAVALPQYNTAVERSRATEALTQMSAVQGAMERYHAQHERWPSNFNQLDIDIPVIDSEAGTYGGKNFTISFASNVITAVRRRDNHSYTLTTTITDNTNGTYTSTRTCTASASDEDAQSFCNAIAGSATKAASGF